jgi:hypothetical protein
MCFTKRTLRKMYKYMPISDHADRFAWIEDIIRNDKIFVPDATKLNDPFEMLFEFNNDAEALATERLKHLMAWKNNRQSIGVISFTSTWSNLLMWSHYAQGYKGICIEFEIVSKLGDEYKVVNYKSKTRAYGKKEIFWTKSKEWKYEKEIRFLSEYYCNSHVPIKTIGLSVSQVILGSNISSTDALKLIKILPANTSLSQVQVSTSKFSLDLVEKDVTYFKKKFIKISNLKKII